MFGKTFSVLFTVAAAALSVSALSIDTPQKLTQCNTVTLKWYGKKAPFVLAVLPSCESDIEDPLLELPPMNATTYEWTVNIPSKMGSIAFAITDAAGNEAYTDEVEIGKNDDVACLNAASTSVSSSVSSTSSGAASKVAPTSTGSVTSSSAPTTLVVTQSYPTGTASVPVNAVGNSGASYGGSGSGSGNGSGNSGTSSSQASGAMANVASVFASMIGVATGLLVVF